MKLRTTLLALLLTLSLGVGLAGQATAATTQSLVFTFGQANPGDCTRFAGSTWTLNPDGSATWDAVVTSSDDGDAWLMWPLFQDTGGNQLGIIENTDHQNPNDRYEFIKDLPDHTQRYRWIGHGWFDPHLFGLIGHMSLDEKC